MGLNQREFDIRDTKKYPFYGSHTAQNAEELIFESNSCVLSLRLVLSSVVFPARNGT